MDSSSPAMPTLDFQSPQNAAQTADRLEALLQGHGMKIFARIDQAAEARAVGLALRPTILLLFGNPKGGTPLMEQFPLLALDLPLKALVWEEEGETAKTRVTLVHPAELQKRYGLPMLPFAAVEALLTEAFPSETAWH